MLDELIDTTLTRLEWELTRTANATRWTEAERQALQEFVDRVGTLYMKIAWQDDAVPLSHIIYEDASMQLIREAADECLQRMGASFSLEELRAD